MGGLLLKAGAVIDTRTPVRASLLYHSCDNLCQSGYTPLAKAALNNELEVDELLLGARAAVDTQTGVSSGCLSAHCVVTCGAARVLSSAQGC